MCIADVQSGVDVRGSLTSSLRVCDCATFRCQYTQERANSGSGRLVTLYSSVLLHFHLVKLELRILKTHFLRFVLNPGPREDSCRRKQRFSSVRTPGMRFLTSKDRRFCLSPAQTRGSFGGISCVYHTLFSRFSSFSSAFFPAPPVEFLFSVFCRTRSTLPLHT